MESIFAEPGKIGPVRPHRPVKLHVSHQKRQRIPVARLQLVDLLCGLAGKFNDPVHLLPPLYTIFWYISTGFQRPVTVNGPASTVIRFRQGQAFREVFGWIVAIMANAVDLFLY